MAGAFFTMNGNVRANGSIRRGARNRRRLRSRTEIQPGFISRGMARSTFLVWIRPRRTSHSLVPLHSVISPRRCLIRHPWPLRSSCS